MSTPAGVSAEIEELIEKNKKSRPIVAIIILFGGIFALLVSIALSISFGAADINLETVWTAVFHFNPDLTPHQIIREIRIPRVLGAALVGSCFAVAGSLMQGMTRNPLADSGLLGLNAGAAFMLALCFAFFPGLPFMYLIMYSFLGAALGAGIVYGMGSMHGRFDTYASCARWGSGKCIIRCA